MPSADRAIRTYQGLAAYYEHQGQAHLRDRFLVLAADAALSAGQADAAERTRAQLLQQNPHHLLKPYASLAEAMKSPDVQSYVGDLRRSYAPDAAAHLLETLRSEDAGDPTAAAEPVPPREEAARPAPPPVPEKKPLAAPPPPPDAPEGPKVYRLQ